MSKKKYLKTKSGKDTTPAKISIQSPFKTATKIFTGLGLLTTLYFGGNYYLDNLNASRAGPRLSIQKKDGVEYMQIGDQMFLDCH